MQSSRIVQYLFFIVSLFACDLFAGELDQIQAYEKQYPEIKYSELRKSIDAGEVFIIDANSAKTYKKGHLPTAASLADEKKLTNQLPFNKTYPMVVYCGGPQCTAWHKAADFATARGYTNVRHYRGGLKDWETQGDRLSTTSI